MQIALKRFNRIIGEYPATAANSVDDGALFATGLTGVPNGTYKYCVGSSGTADRNGSEDVTPTETPDWEKEEMTDRKIELQSRITIWSESSPKCRKASNLMRQGIQCRRLQCLCTVLWKKRYREITELSKGR